jgi:hypothetical protein
MHRPAPPRQDGDVSEEILRRIRVPLMRRAGLTWDGRREDVFVIDLGLSGLFVERLQPIPAGELVEVEFCLPENEIPVAAECRVAWWHPEGMVFSRPLPAGAGLEFLTISARDRERIRGYLTEYYSREPRSRRFVRHGAGTDEGEP